MNPLKDKNIFIFYLYDFLFGLYPIVPIMSLFFLARNLSFGDIGILFAVFSLTGFLFEVPTGYIGDKYGRKLSIQLGLTILTITAYVWTLLHSVTAFAIFAGIWMLGLAFISGSFEGYIYDYLKSKKRESYYDTLLSKSASITYLAGAVGSIVGGYLFSIHITYPYYLLSLLFCASLIAVSLLDPDVDQPDDAQTELKIFAGITHVYKNKPILWLAVYVSLLFGFFSYFRGSIDKPFVLDLHIFDVKLIGIYVAISMVFQSLFMNFFDKVKSKLGEGGTVVLFGIMSSVPLLLMGITRGYIALIAVVIYYMTESFSDTLINSFSQKHIPSKIRATTISSIKVYINCGAAILGLLGGMLFDRVAMHTGFLTVFVAMLFVLVIMLPLRPKSYT